MIAVVNYANDKYKAQQDINTKTAYQKGKVDKVFSYSPQDIDDDFARKHKKVLSYKRGNGLWLWKPYFILKAFEKLEYGDYLFYVDSGVTFLKDVHPLLNKLKASNEAFMVFEICLIECQWTKKEALIEMEAYDEKYRFSNQIMSTFLLLEKNDENIAFVKEWLTYCAMENINAPKDKDDLEDDIYISHREDQSILSILTKKRNIIPFSDPTDYGLFPYQYLQKDRFFKIKERENKYKINEVYFLHSRKVSFRKYLVKFRLKQILNKLGITLRKF